jgi:protease II
MKARALQQVVDIIQRNQYQAAVREVPFVDFTTALSDKSSSNKQMLVF